MNVLLFGATGMVGQGVVRECLLDRGVEHVLIIGRASAGVQQAKVREIVHTDLWHYADIETELTRFDACFFCLGVSSSGMSEEAYARVTYDITLAGGWPGLLTSLAPKTQWVPRPLRTLQRAGTWNACATGSQDGQKLCRQHRYPPLQKTQGLIG